MKALREGLVCGLLLSLIALSLQFGYWIVQLGAATERTETALLFAVADLRGSLALARTGLAEQQGYYRDSARHIKALTGAAAIDAIRFGRLMENVDARMERLTVASERALGSLQSATESVGEQTEQVGNRSAALLEQAGEVVSDLDRLAANPALPRSLQNLEASSANLAAATAAASEATASVRDMLSPAKKSFWRRLLELLLPRPTVRVK